VLNLGVKWRSVVSFMPWPFCPPREKSPQYLKKRKLCALWSWSGHFRLREKSVAHAKNWTTTPQLSSLYPSHYTDCTIPGPMTLRNTDKQCRRTIFLPVLPCGFHLTDNSHTPMYQHTQTASIWQTTPTLPCINTPKLTANYIRLN